MPNLLSSESSPYLLQHASNPVFWYPWGEEPFDQAKKENKPVFLSIGYAACHWCHVMAHESFENPVVADFLNKHFIAIKVDREERPDIDSIYMSAVVHMTGQGGWPLSVFLTPEGEPFFGGTYFPPEPRYGMPSFLQVLKGIAEAWENSRDEIHAVTVQIKTTLVSALDLPEKDDPLDLSSIIDQSLLKMRNAYDAHNGGWGTAPKFPQPMALEVLLLKAVEGDRESQKLAEHNLQEMARGGMMDLIGGGFHRYSTDARWLVPHFEKMLYDNAQLARVYLMAYLQTGNPFYRAVCEDTLDFVIREMKLPQGGYMASLDADSEGEEGKYYLWRLDEIDRAFSETSARQAFSQLFDLPQQGNFDGKIILRFKDQAFNPSADYRTDTFREFRQKLLEIRDQRVKPHADDKVIASWNGLLLSALSEAARYLENERYDLAAGQLSKFLMKQMYSADSGLYRTWREGVPGKPALLEDYAAVILGLLAFNQLRADESIYPFVSRLMDEMMARFQHPQSGFYDSQKDPTLIFRGRDIQDNALPSGNALAAQVLLAFFTIDARDEYRAIAQDMLGAAADLVSKYPTSFAAWLKTALIANHAPETLVISIPTGGDSQGRNRTILPKTYRPFRWIIQVTDQTRDAIPEIAKNKPSQNHLTTYYFCENFVCKVPTVDIDQIT